MRRRTLARGCRQPSQAAPAIKHNPCLCFPEAAAAHLVVEEFGCHHAADGHEAVGSQRIHAQRAAAHAAAAARQARHVRERGHVADGGAAAVAQQARGVGVQADACGAGRGRRARAWWAAATRVGWMVQRAVSCSGAHASLSTHQTLSRHSPSSAQTAPQAAPAGGSHLAGGSHAGAWAAAGAARARPPPPPPPPAAPRRQPAAAGCRSARCPPHPAAPGTRPAPRPAAARRRQRRRRPPPRRRPVAPAPGPSGLRPVQGRRVGPPSACAGQADRVCCAASLHPRPDNRKSAQAQAGDAAVRPQYAGRRAAAGGGQRGRAPRTPCVQPPAVCRQAGTERRLVGRRWERWEMWARGSALGGSLRAHCKMPHRELATPGQTRAVNACKRLPGSLQIGPRLRGPAAGRRLPPRALRVWAPTMRVHCGVPLRSSYLTIIYQGGDGSAQRDQMVAGPGGEEMDE